MQIVRRTEIRLALAASACLVVAEPLAEQAGAARAAPARSMAASLCKPAEKILYSCPYRARAVSVCLGDGQVRYRFGRPGRTELEIASDGKDGKARFGLLRGQVNGEQVSVRFVNGRHHYVVYSAVLGDATIRPGEQRSGLVVEKDGATISEQSCPLKGAMQSGSGLHALRDMLPADEADAWY